VLYSEGQNLDQAMIEEIGADGKLIQSIQVSQIKASFRF
jgi:hypothetical protein